jgi:ADP-dependent NAD(P)H-hydrate dehydratase / NAD(P)H-hydrate epimerase
MSSLPLAVHTAAQVRALDRLAIEELRIPSYTLMTRAGEAALRTLRSCWPSAQSVLVVCGPGNNGGDGYVLARLGRERLTITVLAVSDPTRLAGDARRAYADFVAAGGTIRSPGEVSLADHDVIVDAIFGTGLARPVESGIADVIHAINDARAHVLALDMPSGLHADSGEVLGAAVVAERTLTFVGLKLGFYVGEGPDHTGVITFDDLEIPASAVESVGSIAQRIDEDVVVRLLPRRRRTAHKGQHGSVLVIGGSVGMAGAARMAGEAALRAGAGLVTVATRSENVSAIISGRPELICRGVETAADVAAMIAHADVIAIGPGLGQDPWAQSVLDAALCGDKPMILDADALNLLAQSPRTNSRWILTPHPGEAARLLGRSTALIQRDRLGAAREISARYGGTVVLKGAGTVVVSGDAVPSICDQGNPGMASPGMGDVLTGVIAGIAAQTSDLAGAARAGVLVHAMAGDMAARRGERGLLATDLLTYLPTCVNPAQHS